MNLRDIETGVEQVIISNRIHPFFVQIPAEQGEVSLGAAELSSEGHVYTGPIPNGFWIDAADLQPGFRLLGSDQGWSEVVGVEAVNAPLQAFNLTVGDYSTYFVSGNEAGEPVWVHNVCGASQFGETAFRGLNRNRPLGDLTDADLDRLFSNSPFTLSSHARMRIRDPRIRSSGFETPDDIQRLLNRGEVSPGRDGAVNITKDGVTAVINPDTNRIITVSFE